MGPHKYNKNTENNNYSKKITKTTNQGSDTGKYNKPLKESWEWGLTNITKIPKITIIPKITNITNHWGPFQTPNFSCADSNA